MSASLPPQTHERPRSRSYPPTTSVHSTSTSTIYTTTHRLAGGARLHKSEPCPSLSAPPAPRSHPPLFEDEIDDDPGQHFLSPVYMYEYEDWADDSGDEESPDEIEWNAGITDFALFDTDRRRAQERHEDVPDRWEGLIASQVTALQRAVERNRADSDPSKHRSWTPLLEDVPQLTPDSSPSLHDLDSQSFSKLLRNTARSTPQRPSIMMSNDDRHDDETPSSANAASSEDSIAVGDERDMDVDDVEDETSLSFFLPSDASNPIQHRFRLAHSLERPGLRYNRTMSGKIHVWRRPSFNIYTVGEDTDAEREAEASPVRDKVSGTAR